MCMVHNFLNLLSLALNQTLGLGNHPTGGLDPLNDLDGLFEVNEGRVGDLVEVVSYVPKEHLAITGPGEGLPPSLAASCLKTESRVVIDEAVVQKILVLFAQAASRADLLGDSLDLLFIVLSLVLGQDPVVHVGSQQVQDLKEGVNEHAVLEESVVAIVGRFFAAQAQGLSLNVTSQVHQLLISELRL